MGCPRAVAGVRGRVRVVGAAPLLCACSKSVVRDPREEVSLPAPVSAPAFFQPFTESKGASMPFVIMHLLLFHSSKVLSRNRLCSVAGMYDWHHISPLPS